MTREELEKEAEEWLNKWELCNKCDHKVQCIEDNAMCPQVVERAYLTGAEPREKRIAELKEKLTKKVTLESLVVVSGKITELEEAKANLEYLLEGRDNEITDLEKKNKVLKQNLEDTEIINKALEKENAELKKTYRKQRNKRIDELQKENKELKKQLEMSNKVYNDNLDYSHHIEGQLTRAKEIIRSLYFIIQGRIDYKGNIPLEDEMYRANQFLNSEVEK